ncbi:MAG: hypothetical protein IMZ52_07665 [Actinobacteria bacterium]|nr:hypothetical protein [Actinomycetota bacterium]MBE3114596.1 hypothetical protein [Actinomycetota bacterium]
MVGSKIPVLEVERLGITDDGRGVIFYEDGKNAHINTINHSIIKYSGSADGWLKFGFVSGSTYGATGATAYVPFYRTKPTA